MTPPAVSQGAVAFGATVVPFYQLPGSVGTPGTQIPQPEPRVVPFTYRNVEVLAALQKLTGEDFGYDIPSWRNWISRKFNPIPSQHVGSLSPDQASPDWRVRQMAPARSGFFLESRSRPWPMSGVADRGTPVSGPCRSPAP